MAGLKDLTPFLLPQAVAITFTGALFLGFHLISVAFANRWLIFTDEGWKIRKKIHWYNLSITNISAVLVVIAQVVTLSTSMAEASFVEQGHLLADHEDPPWKAIVRCTVSGIIVLMADSILIYRLWVTYRKQMPIVWFPIILWLGGVACVALQLFLQVKNISDLDFGPYQWAKVNMNVGPGIVFLPFLASTIILSAYCTGLLIWRLWSYLKDSENNSTIRQLQFLIRVLMESGILYLAISIAHFFVYFGRDNFAIHLVGLLHTTVVGISYNLIIIRVGQNRSEDERNSTMSKMTSFQVADMTQVISTGSSVGTGEMADLDRDKEM